MGNWLYRSRGEMCGTAPSSPSNTVCSQPRIPSDSSGEYRNARASSVFRMDSRALWRRQKQMVCPSPRGKGVKNSRRLELISTWDQDTALTTFTSGRICPWGPSPPGGSDFVGFMCIKHLSGAKPFAEHRATGTKTAPVQPV